MAKILIIKGEWRSREMDYRKARWNAYPLRQRESNVLGAKRENEKSYGNIVCVAGLFHHGCGAGA